MKKLGRLLMPIMVAVMLGPLIAGLSFCGLAVYTSLSEPGTAGPLADMLTMFVIYIGFAYFAGGPIALLAGLLVSIWMIWRPPGFVVAIAAAAAAVGLFRLADIVGIPSPLLPGPFVSNNLTLIFVLSVVAAGVCWLVTGRLARRLLLV